MALLSLLQLLCVLMLVNTLVTSLPRDHRCVVTPPRSCCSACRRCIAVPPRHDVPPGRVQPPGHEQPPGHAQPPVVSRPGRRPALSPPTTMYCVWLRRGNCGFAQRLSALSAVVLPCRPTNSCWGTNNRPDTTATLCPPWPCPLWDSSAMASSVANLICRVSHLLRCGLVCCGLVCRGPRLPWPCPPRAISAVSQVCCGSPWQ